MIKQKKNPLFMQVKLMNLFLYVVTNWLFSHISPFLDLHRAYLILNKTANGQEIVTKILLVIQENPKALFHLMA
jgi:hypothetical protein